MVSVTKYVKHCTVHLKVESTYRTSDSSAESFIIIEFHLARIKTNYNIETHLGENHHELKKYMTF